MQRFLQRGVRVIPSHHMVHRPVTREEFGSEVEDSVSRQDGTRKEQQAVPLRCEDNLYGQHISRVTVSRSDFAKGPGERSEVQCAIDLQRFDVVVAHDASVG